ncbi:glycosyltransferase family 2 protein [Chlamydiota bacterium]
MHNIIDVSILIVTWRVKELLDDCFQSIKENTSCSYEIIVVDNNSRDGTVELIKEKYSEIKLIMSDKNLGFAKANNVGIKIARGENVLLLNPDTIVLAHAIDNMLKVLGKRNNVGAVGPKVLNKDGSIQLTCGRKFPTIFTEFLDFTELDWLVHHRRFYKADCMKNWNHDSEKEVDVLSGCCMMIRKKAINQVGGLDENLFMYGDDILLCWEIKQYGWKVHFTPTSKIIHLSGQSSKKEFKALRFEVLEAQLYLFRKIHNHVYSFIYRNVVLITSSLWFFLECFKYIFVSHEIEKMILSKYLDRIKWALYRKKTREKVV